MNPAGAATAPYQTGFARWRAADGRVSAWQCKGVGLGTDGVLGFDPQTALAGTAPYPAGGYYVRSFYNGGSFLVGEALSLVSYLATAPQGIGQDVSGARLSEKVRW